MNKYWDNINELYAQQRKKGINKYGQVLEDNVTLTTQQRLEHLQEELIDGLMYAEHLKALNSSITANDYQRAALRTATNLSNRDKLFENGVLGLVGETGEVADLLKKHLFQGHNLDIEKVVEELGDVAWYLAVTAFAVDVDLSYILQKNIDKLKQRYPEGFDKK